MQLLHHEQVDHLVERFATLAYDAFCPFQFVAYEPPLLHPP